MGRHGNYRMITHREAYEDSLARDYTMVGLDDVVYRGGPGIGRVALHIVAPDNFYQMDDPTGYQVQLVRPSWLYGDEGLLSELEFIGRLSDDWLDVHEEDWFPEDDPFSEYSDFVWALPNAQYNFDTKEFDSVPWKRVGWDWFEALRTGDVNDGNV